MCCCCSQQDWGGAELRQKHEEEEKRSFEEQSVLALEDRKLALLRAMTGECCRDKVSAFCTWRLRSRCPSSQVQSLALRVQMKPCGAACRLWTRTSPSRSQQWQSS